MLPIRFNFRVLAVTMLTLKSVFLAMPVQAAGYESSDDDDDMLQPSELNDSGVAPNPANDSAVFLGGGLSFGQARPTEGSSSPGMAYLLRFEPGYQVKTGSWNRLELSAEFLYGQLGFRLNSDRLDGAVRVPLDFGMLAKLGYGYSLGSGIMALARIGVGPLVAHVKADVDGIGAQTTSTTGIAAQLGWMLALPLGDHLDATGGLSLTHTEFDVGRFKGDGVAYNYGRTVIANVPALDLGLRYRF
jgi:hypothetical protein